MDIKIESSWKNVLRNEFSQSYFQQIIENIKKDIHEGKTIYPPGKFIFNAFNQTPFDQVKVVLIGQDPYHGKGQAHGLCFSVQDEIKPPPSLVNIFKELKNDLGIEIPNKGNLSKWAQQGVLLLNASLTVRENDANSHSKIGWQIFTDRVISILSEQRVGLVFLLWGKFAQEKEVLIDKDKHYILKAAHPSPFSADHGFCGCKHFSKTNEILIHEGFNPIDWSL